MTENPNTNIWTWLDSGPEIWANTRLLMARPIRKSKNPGPLNTLLIDRLTTCLAPVQLIRPTESSQLHRMQLWNWSVSVWTETTTLSVSDISAGNTAFNKIILFPPQTQTHKHTHTSPCSPTRTFRHIDKHTTSHLWHKKSSRASCDTQTASGVTQQPLLIFPKETQNLAVLFLRSLLSQLLQVRSCEEVVFLILQLTEWQRWT